MTTAFFIIIIFLGIITSIMIQHHLSKLPLPIIYIVMGVILSVIPLYRHFTFDPSLFLFIIVAPLLYNDAKSASRYWIGRGFVNIISLSIVLVLITVIGVGTLIHGIFPIIPLSLAIAITAIVTPTDATAVSAFSHPNKNLQIPYIILQNESLFNDATGFVTLNIALTMYLSGTFSIGTAVSEFLLEFGGGLLFGMILGFIAHFLRSILFAIGDDEPLIMVILEVLVPFIAYFLADELNLSGILAVVAAGLVQGAENDNLQLTSSKLQLVQENAWELVEQILTGVIFLILGISLPTIISEILDTGVQNIFILILIGLTIYVFKFLIRLIWTRYLVWMHLKRSSRWHDSWIMSFSGASGTISLALALLLPKSINQNAIINRDALIFIVLTIIIISMVLAAIFVPKLTKPSDSDEEVKPFDQWFREMIMVAMNTIQKTTDHRPEAEIVVDTLSRQLHSHKIVNHKKRNQIYRQAYEIEKQTITELFTLQKITEDEYIYYLEFLNLSLKTATGNLLTNFILRLKFGLHIGKLYRDLGTVQDMFLTSPQLAEQFYWVNQFELHNEDIKPIENAGFNQVMKYLKEISDIQATSIELHDVRSFYRDRHRRMQQANPNPKIFYQLFLDAFKAEFEFLQRAIQDNKIEMDTAESLQEHIIYDQMSMIRNSSNYTKNYSIQRYDKNRYTD
ncbi:sodium:proton antiporter [Lentilactobacillus laojiaonis]|nr:sodium:proton antiporter [Lentilactobacillus laojiaonis]